MLNAESTSRVGVLPQTKTRGQILALLRQGSSTAEDLARNLGITTSAVRSQLGKLEAEGLIQHKAVRLGPRKPHHSCSLTPLGELLFCRAYVPIVRTLLDALEGRLTADALLETVRDAGRRLAEQDSTVLPDGDPVERIPRVISLFEQLGGFLALEQQEEKFALQSPSCPLGAIVNAHPEMCRLLETFVGSIVDAPVHEACIRGEYPRCRFEIAAR